MFKKNIVQKIIATWYIYQKPVFFRNILSFKKTVKMIPLLMSIFDVSIILIIKNKYAPD